MSPAATLPLHAGRPVRRGFTLVELMIVVVIISILVALLLPALFGGKRTANIARVKFEIGAFEHALADFKATFGDYPPSRIVLYEDKDLATGWNDQVTSWNPTTDARASRAIIRRFWPQFNFNVDRDINQDGDASDTITLEGAECLTFFLGGMSPAGSSATVANQTRSNNALNGFSKDASNPFNAAGANRVGPFHEFELGRLHASTVVTGMLVYFDPLPGQAGPYLYASSYDGRGYNTADVSSRLSGGVYLQASGGPAWKNKSFQIISPGFDGQFGVGGVWTEDSADATLTGSRNAERDNITNFHNTTLAPF